MSAKEMFEKLGYDYYEDDGFTVYLKGDCRPNRLNTEYIKFRKISFNRLSEEFSVYDYYTDATCELINNLDSNMKLNIITLQELQAINKQIEEIESILLGE